MKRVFGLLSKYFLHKYQDFPLEIQQKMRNLVILGVGGIGIACFMLMRALYFTDDIFEVVVGIYMIICIAVSLCLLKRGSPVSAGNAASLVIFYTFINLVMRDFFSTQSRQMSRLNDVGIEIMFGLLISCSYILLKRQYLVLVVSSYFIITFHFFVLVVFHFGGVAGYGEVVSFIETFIFILTAQVFALFILSLTRRERSGIFTNVILYKLVRNGPTVIFSEHPLADHMEETSGAYYYTAIGQGAQYSSGLFGPLPFGVRESNKVAIIFATRLPDSSLTDARLKGINYLLVALITTLPKAQVVDRERLEKRMYEITSRIKDLAPLTETDIQAIVRKIRGEGRVEKELLSETPPPSP